MAAYALIIGLAHVSGTPVVISGPEIPYDQQRARFKEIMPLRVHPEYQSIQFVDSRRGVRKRKNLLSPKTAKARESAEKAEKKVLAQIEKHAASPTPFKRQQIASASRRLLDGAPADTPPKDDESPKDDDPSKDDEPPKDDDPSQQSESSE